ncbi:MAG: hypothetical protein KBT89_16910 [Gammaproteobacteria bacterium]|nr:hypothetical protein [Gammaproteobacteria bacterium]
MDIEANCKKISMFSGKDRLALQDNFNILHRCPAFAGPEPYSRKMFQ